MNKFVLILIMFAIFLGIIPRNSLATQADLKENIKAEFKETFTGEVEADPKTGKRLPLYNYSYQDREHSLAENVKNIGIVYGMTWFFYPIVQPKIFHGAGGIKTYSRNFGKLVFDQDEPFWNNFVHPLSGSQLYLLYRADGYDRLSAFEMTFVSSALFEMTVEIFTEPGSVQDLYQTPVLGTVLGFGIENASMYLLNSGNTLGKILGHAINPATLLPLYSGRTLIIPKIEDADKGAMIRWDLKF
ncbi:MAG: DUF3943 domain-containing protein [Bacteriovorax sp.]|nr:DUF3943 domain-containing protein [Bacteriovorax sp.]